jgi:hypothetical protein
VSGFEIVAGIIAAFFVIGIGVGVIVMIALSALRYRRAVRDDDWRSRRHRPLGRRDAGTDWREPSGPGRYDEYEGDEDDDGPHRWPGR